VHGMHIFNDDMIGTGDHVLLADGLVHIVEQNWLRPREEGMFCFDVLCQRASVIVYRTEVSVTKEAVTCLICVGH